MSVSAISDEELEELIQRILKSGELGRSQTYAGILNYLLKCTREGIAPKEIAIAIDVLGRDVDFDVAKDSIVRVHFYHLRNKLKAYFEKHGKNEKYKITIPKGQYLLTTELISFEHNKDETKQGTSGPFNKWYALAIVILLIGLNVFQYTKLSTAEEIPSPNSLIAGQMPWLSMMDDETPIIIVVGDYYIFGELDESGGIARMVREFDINSQQELEQKQSDAVQNNTNSSAYVEGSIDNYFNLDLSYIPTSMAFALAQVMPVLASRSDKVSIKMMSELNTIDLVENHIIYMGYLSGLGSLHDLMFAASDLSIGETYDELFNLETDEYFYSSSGLAIGENSFQDYGMVSSFPSLGGNQFIMITGMRDEGLINVSQEITNLNELKSIHSSLQGTQTEAFAFEALYEVLGFDGTNFDANRVYLNALATDIIWEARLFGSQER